MSTRIADTARYFDTTTALPFSGSDLVVGTRTEFGTVTAIKYVPTFKHVQVKFDNAKRPRIIKDGFPVMCYIGGDN